MLSEHERQILNALERRMGVEDPELAHLLAAGPGPRTRLRTLGRHLISTPVLVMAVVLGIAGCALHLSALGVLFFLWAVCGTVVRDRRARRKDAGRTNRGSRGPGRRAGWS